jgi:PhzF family phenazine biosynthesis protein
MANLAWHGKRYRQVDVFADEPMAGNGLSVFWDSKGLSASDMQALTIELRQFESVFLEQSGASNEYRARIFTMEEELDFAGHPILGATAVLHEKYSNRESEAWVVQMRKSTVRVRTERRRGAYFATMYQPPPIFSTSAISELDAQVLLGALNLKVEDIYPGLPLEIVSTGLPYVIVPLQSNIGNATILIDNLEELLRRQGAKFIYIYDVEKAEGRTWDNKGNVEDIATGSAAGPVAAYLCKHGKLSVGQELTINQGQYVGRPSKLKAKVLGTRENFGEIEVAGAIQMVSESVLD